MKKDQYVKVRKLKAVPNPDGPTPNWKDYIPGQDNGDVSLPTDYTLEGTLFEDVKVGNCMYINRTVRNGERIPGTTATSPVTSIAPTDAEHAVVRTRNSIYLVEVLP